MSPVMWRSCVLIICLVIESSTSQRALGRYNIDRNGITTSGISSGASMAIQMHVAHSSYFNGVASIAGSPYWCAKGDVQTALNACMRKPDQVDVNELVTKTRSYESARDIDATSNMANDRVYILHGRQDTVVSPGESPLIDQYYRTFLPSANIRTHYTLEMGHAQPTMNYGNLCSTSNSPYINKCSFDGAYELRNWLYGENLVIPSGSTRLQGEFYTFDQKEFFYPSSPRVSSMDTAGFVYVPSGCVSSQNKCRLHVAFHGCLMGRHKLNDEYARHSGYNEVGELNNIIILYPQAIASRTNVNGCWDWWGYTVNFYATKRANQPLAIISMVDKLIAPLSRTKNDI